MKELTAIIRTGAAFVAGAIVAYLVGVNLPVEPAAKDALIGALSIVFANGYYLGVTFAGRYVPWIRYLLVIPTEPTYGSAHDLFWAFLRTLVPSAIGYLFSLAPVAAVLDTLAVGQEVRTLIIVSITAAAQSGYYAVIKWAESILPVFAILLGGKPATAVQLAYEPKHAAA